jgi:hypothetical protein
VPREPSVVSFGHAFNPSKPQEPQTIRSRHHLLESRPRFVDELCEELRLAMELRGDYRADAAVVVAVNLRQKVFEDLSRSTEQF